ncbi:ATP-binding protein [Pseudalkalibacillus berkeleyi]|uniref:histidine kinase n=1 Tax=Pseudalkalibacillus berkeleyi TaxID=1069813 RepID=A0ABS9H5R3_9BACL|nr:ATP-binding protein [Pseudalkalibacillus berkeleyi]MCF6139218.1 ATP-binding protein [Pseudalkalibacillus berkeleyi]
MLAEKLLLHVLIFLAPVLVYGVLFEKSKDKQYPYIYGILHGAAACLCMVFAYFSYDLFWDFRYVPLVLASLYGGPISGAIVFVVIIITRTVLGGDALLFGYISATIAAIVPFVFSRKFMNDQPKKRVRMAIIVGAWPAIVMLGILVSYLLTAGFETSNEIWVNITLFGAIQIIGIGFAAMLNEMVIERKLMKAEIQRSEKLNTLGELAASIAHEVRNPLTVVKGFLQLMKKENKDDHTQYIPLVLSELGRAEAIINDYLNFAKPEFKKIEECQLSDIIYEVLFLMEPLALKQGVQLDIDLDTRCTIKTDRNQLKQAIVNFVKNAIEATDDGGMVSIKLTNHPQYARLSVKDTGKGMTPEQVKRIGTLFYTTKDKGTGLGTTVSLRIIESIGGRVKYESKLEVGTEVTVFLPIIEPTVELVSGN